MYRIKIKVESQSKRDRESEKEILNMECILWIISLENSLENVNVFE